MRSFEKKVTVEIPDKQWTLEIGSETWTGEYTWSLNGVDSSELPEAPKTADIYPEFC